MPKKQDLSNELRLLYHRYFEKTEVVLAHKQHNIVLAGVPIHNNLGDQAIVLAEKKFLDDFFPTCHVVIIEESHVQNSLASLAKQLKFGDVICYHGGGNIGSLYPVVEKQRRFLVKNLSIVPIISFPESIYFEPQKLCFLKHSQKVYNNHSDLTLITRENFSQIQAHRLFYRNKQGLTPDIVFYLLKSFSPHFKQPGFAKALMVLRDDRESSRRSDFTHKIEGTLQERFAGLARTDTMSDNLKIRTNQERKMSVIAKIKEFEAADVIVTDRLHGMLFAILAGRPVIVLKNSNFKISSTVDTWLRDCPFVFLLEHNTVSTLRAKLTATTHVSAAVADRWYNQLDFEKWYQPLLQAIKNGLEGKA